MSADVAFVDHPVIAVADLEASRTTFERLGFTVTALGRHLEWGTGNLCIMFPHDYLELRGIVDASRYTHHLDAFLAQRGEGLMGVAFAPRRSAAVSHAAAVESGIAPAGHKPLTRRFLLPEGDAFPSFDIVYLADADAPGLLTTVICEQKTPELIRRPAWLQHANSVTGVARMVSVVSDPSAHVERYRRLFGGASIDAHADRVTLSFDRGCVVDVLSPRAAAGAGLALFGPPLPYLSALVLEVARLGDARATLSSNGVPFTSRTGYIEVAPGHACGVILRFAERVAG